MFEREFEFKVYHPLEVCEERILDMERAGCKPFKWNRVEVDVASVKPNVLSEFYIWEHTRNQYGIAIEGILEQVDDSLTHVSGEVGFVGFSRTFWLKVALFINAYLILTFFSEHWNWIYLVIFAGVLIVVAVHYFDGYRKRFVEMLEEVLTQQKKKNEYEVLPDVKTSGL